MASANDQWREILDPDEDILWQGRPVTQFIFKPSMIATMIFGIFFAGFALFWMLGAARGGGSFWMFGLIHFTAGIGVAFTPVFWPRFLRKRTWYTLTNKRGFIATNLPIVGRRIRSYPINADTMIEYAPGDIASVYFGQRTVRKNRQRQDVPDGFESIRDGADVMKLIRNLQTDTPATP